MRTVYCNSPDHGVIHRSNGEKFCATGKNELLCDLAEWPGNITQNTIMRKTLEMIGRNSNRLKAQTISFCVYIA